MPGDPTWTDEREAAALARCEAASPAPWMLPYDDGAIARPYDERDARIDEDNGNEPDPTDMVSLCGLDEDGMGIVGRREDAAFIAHARTDLPDAIAELRRMRAELRKWEDPDADGSRLADAREQYRTSGASRAAAAVYVTALEHALGHAQAERDERFAERDVVIEQYAALEADTAALRAERDALRAALDAYRYLRDVAINEDGGLGILNEGRLADAMRCVCATEEALRGR